MSDATISLQARVSILSLATLARAYEERGIRLRSKSDLIWQAVEDAARLVEKTGAQRFTSYSEATAYMSLIRLDLPTNDRANRGVKRALEIEDIDVEGIEFGKREAKRPSPLDIERMYEMAATAMRVRGVEPISKEAFLAQLIERTDNLNAG